jgi:hypothetical protein
MRKALEVKTVAASPSGSYAADPGDRGPYAVSILIVGATERTTKTLVL